MRLIELLFDLIESSQALLLGQDANSPYGFFNGQRCHMCLRSDSLHKVMERLANPGIISFTNKPFPLSFLHSPYNFKN